MHNLLAGKAWPKGWEELPQKNQAHDRQEILVAGIVGVGPQGVSRTPEPFFNGIHMFELGQRRICCFSLNGYYKVLCNATLNGFTGIQTPVGLFQHDSSCKFKQLKSNSTIHFSPCMT